jgi:mono/diheme cytochrome c family protein
VTTNHPLFYSALQKSALAALLLFGVSFALPQDEDPTTPSTKNSLQRYAELAKAPEKARARSNPLASDPDAVAAGRKLFEGHCAECHGNAGEGGKKAPSLRVQAVQQATPGTLFWVLTNGVVRRGMPVWSKLPEPQRWQIVSYLKSLGPSDK